MAQRFYNLVLLPRVVEDLKFNKRLNYHLYQVARLAPRQRGLIRTSFRPGRTTALRQGRQARRVGSGAAGR